MKSEKQIRNRLKYLRKCIKGKETPPPINLVVCLDTESEIETLKWVLDEGDENED